MLLNSWINLAKALKKNTKAEEKNIPTLFNKFNCKETYYLVKNWNQ